MSATAPAQKKWMTWTGRVLSALVSALLAFGGIMKMMQPKEMVDGFTGQFGFPLATLTPIGILELACALLYAIPRTRVFGAILVAAYLGGAVVTHVRVGDVFIMPIVVGVAAWAGLFLRDARLRALLPLVSDQD